MSKWLDERMNGHTGKVLRLVFILVLGFSINVQAKDSVSVAGIEKLLIKDACTDLIKDYGLALDNQDLDLLTATFTEDGVWGDKLTSAVRIKGHAALREFWGGNWAGGGLKDKNMRGIHNVQSTRIRVVNKDAATGTAFIGLYIHDVGNAKNNPSLAASMLVGVDVKCVNTSTGWLLEELLISPAMNAAWGMIPDFEGWDEGEAKK